MILVIVFEQTFLFYLFKEVVIYLYAKNAKKKRKLFLKCDFERFKFKIVVMYSLYQIGS